MNAAAQVAINRAEIFLTLRENRKASLAHARVAAPKNAETSGRKMDKYVYAERNRNEASRSSKSNCNKRLNRRRTRKIPVATRTYKKRETPSSGALSWYEYPEKKRRDDRRRTRRIERA